MSQGLNNTNTELVKTMDTIIKQKNEIQVIIEKEEEEKRKLEEQMRSLSERLDVINNGLGKKYQTRDEYDRTINETQSAFNKILESSQTLLHVLKKEGSGLYKKKQQITGNDKYS